MKAQKNQEFDWIVFFDKETPGWARAKIEAAQSERRFHARFTPLFRESGWREAVRETLDSSPNCDLICTTNLDSDDALSSDYFQRLRNKIQTTNITTLPLALNFRNGFILNNCRIFEVEHKSNAFTNVLEDACQDFRTCNAFPHMKLSRDMTVVQECGPPAWIQVVHEINVSNKIRGKLASKPNLSSFDYLNLSTKADIGFFEFIVERFLKFQFRRMRDLFANIVNSFRDIY